MPLTAVTGWNRSRRQKDHDVWKKTGLLPKPVFFVYAADGVIRDINSVSGS